MLGNRENVLGRMMLKLITGKLVLVYQMPKTGSQTIERTLQESAIADPVFRFHYLAQTRADSLRALAYSTSDRTWQQNMLDPLELMTRFCRIMRLRRFLSACRVSIPRLRVISGVRDVIEAALSSIFENHAMFVPKVELLTAEKCREMFCEWRGMCQELQEWFDVEIGRHIGIDVYSRQFPVNQGYQVYEKRSARLLVYRFEFLSKLAPVLQKFIGVPIRRLVPQNLSESKHYADHYRSVKRSLRLPPEVVAEQVNGKLMRHFYSPEERCTLEAKWSGALGADAEQLNLPLRVNSVG
jgi:Putative capsular polysaccharide synthesis protein